MWPRLAVRLALLVPMLLAVLLAAPAHAAPTHIAARLVVEAPAAAGGETTVAILMQPEPGWHGYWLNPGDAGFGMTLRWRVPEGVLPGPPRYPVPRTLTIAGLMNHVYESDYAILSSLTLPRGAPAGARLPLELEAEWLACTDQVCVPERGVLRAEVRVAAPGEPIVRDTRFDTWRQRLPAPLGAEARFALDARALRLAIPLPASVPLAQPHLFVAQERIVDYAAAQKFGRRGNLLIVEIPRARLAPADAGTLRGVLRLEGAGELGLAIAARPGPVPAADQPVAVGGGNAAPAPLAWLVLAALAGGLLLNVMPCVFPILSLKALSLARAGESDAEARAEGLAYAAGVVTATAALGALLLGLRAAGEEVGWAFQLQEPWVVVLLLLLATAITANLAGLFEFAVPGFASTGSPRGAFATGLLAAFVATPCTGPFMAAAMGAALLLPVLPAMLLFVALGLGIALPFLAVAFIPALRRRLPRPGPWMVRFRHWMALPMGLTALALVWLLWRQGGSGFAIAVAGLAIALTGVLVVTGRAQRRGRAALRPFLAGFVPLLVLLAILPWQAFRPRAAHGIESILPTKPFSEAALAAARATGKPAFVYFTADWCLTCKVNEQTAIEREAVRAAFARAGVSVLAGDWTRRDPAITRFLTAHGAAGVPLYLWYPANQGAPRQLPQILSQAMLVDLAD